MSRVRWTGLILILLSAGVSIIWGSAVGRSVPGGALDFQGVYYGTRCLLQGCDPYSVAELQSFYQTQGDMWRSLSNQRREVVTLYVNLPTTSLLVAPFAKMPWISARWLWMSLMSAGFVLAGVLMWSIGARHSPGIALFLTCILLANSEVLFATGNTAGLVVSLCVIGVYCLLQDRFVLAGILCLVASLAMKPHDAGLIWLYFLLAGGILRKRALQTLGATAALGIVAFLWVSHEAPQWTHEIRSNLAAISAPGGLNEPGPASITSRTAGMVVDLQAAVSVFWDNPHIYNPVSYVLCGCLLICWSAKLLRTRFSPASAWLALAAIMPLSMLITYHRPYDTRLLLVSIPACTMLWAEGGLNARFALVVTTAAIIFTGDVPLAAFIVISNSVLPATSGFLKLILTLLLTRPASLVLLVMAVFYTWIFLRGASSESSSTPLSGPEIGALPSAGETS